MPYTLLPDEIWVLVATCLTIDDIEALSSTCRGLRVLLLSSSSLWRTVVRDLLMISPSILLSRSIASQTARSLRTKALHFRNIDRILSMNDRQRLRSLKDLHLLPPAQQVAFRILPGTPYGVYVSALASVDIVCLSTGDKIDVWWPSNLGSIRACNDANLYVSDSAKYGLLIAAVVEIQKFDTQDRQFALWLFHVEDIIKPKLTQLAIRDIDSPPEQISLEDETLVMAWNQGNENPILEVIEVSLVASGHGCSLQSQRWLLPRLLDDMTVMGIHVVRRDIVVVALATHLIFIHLATEGLNPGASLPLVQEFHRFPLPLSLDERGVAFGRRYEDRYDSTTIVDVEYNEYGYTFVVSHNHSKVDLVQSWMTPLLLDTDEILYSRCGPQRVLSVALGDDRPSKPALQWTRRRAIAREEVEVRLGTAERADFAMDLSDRYDQRILDLEYDEWTGIAVLVWLSLPTGLHERITVVTI